MWCLQLWVSLTINLVFQALKGNIFQNHKFENGVCGVGFLGIRPVACLLCRDGANFPLYELYELFNSMLEGSHSKQLWDIRTASLVCKMWDVRLLLRKKFETKPVPQISPQPLDPLNYQEDGDYVFFSPLFSHAGNIFMRISALLWF